MTTLNDVDLEAKQVTAYSATTAGLAEMRDRFNPELIPEEVTSENYQTVKEAATTLQKLRTGLDKKRKAIKAPYLEATKLIDGQAKELTEQISEIEEPWKAAKTEYDERAKRKEEARQAKIEEMFGYLRTMRENAYTMDSGELAEVLEILNAETCEGAMERVSDAIELRNKIIDEVGKLYAQKVDQERMEAENARLQEAQRIDKIIAEYKSMVADYMESGRQELDDQIEAMELAEFPDFGDRHSEVVDARDKALAGLLKLQAMLPEEEVPEGQYGNPGEHIRSEEQASILRHPPEAAAPYPSNNTQLVREPSNSTRVEREPRLSEYQRGYIDALEAFAHWKDGTQYVGTSGKTLEQAIKEFMEEPAASNF